MAVKPGHIEGHATEGVEHVAESTLNLRRVTRFRAETDQAMRWLAFALTEVEKGFRRISGHKDLPQLVAALVRKQEGDSPSDPPGPLTSPTAQPKAPAES